MGVRRALAFDRGFGPTYEPRPMRAESSTSRSSGGRGAWLAVAVMVVTSLSARTAAAQATDAADGDTAVAPAPAASAPRAFGNIDADKVPVDEKKDRVESMLGEQRQALGRVVEILSEARSSKDIVQLNCVNEKLTQVKGLLKISEQASLQMYESIASNARDLVNHEYTKVVVAHQKTGLLRTAAEQCVGESSIYSGETQVDVEIDGEGGGSDPTTAATPPPGPAVPPVASTF